MLRHEPFAGCHAIVLAAGAASRFDGAKLVAPFAGQPLVCRAVGAALDSRVERVTVILGSRADEVEAALEPLRDKRLELVRCADWQDGLSASLRCGLSHLPDCRAAVIFLGDMPNVSAALADRVLKTVMDGAPAAFPEYGGSPGHPVAIASDLFRSLERLKGDQGARAFLEGTKGVVRLTTGDAGCVQDVDTRHDLTRLASA
ncbi:MAG: nucleotidyltransferase family protein [Allopontixanthobacter sediminis]